MGMRLILLAAALWGTTGTAQAFAPLNAPPLVIGALRLMIGGAALVVFAGHQGLLHKWRALPLWPTTVARDMYLYKAIRRHWLPVTLRLVRLYD